MDSTKKALYFQMIKLDSKMCDNFCSYKIIIIFYKLLNKIVLFFNNN